ncbi:MAG: hypothetical protein ACLR13_01900 [Acutalibacteraceae bacterium]
MNPVKSGKRIYAFGLPTLYGLSLHCQALFCKRWICPHTSSFKMTLNIAIFLVAVYALVFLLIYPKIPNYREEMEEEEGGRGGRTTGRRCAAFGARVACKRK